MKTVLVQRYDNELDILAIAERGYSDVYDRSKREDFDLVLVVPTSAARTSVTVVATPTSKQYKPTDDSPAWPGKPDNYKVRIDVRNVRYTSVERVKAAFASAGLTWAAAWKIMVADLEEEIFLEPADLATLEMEAEAASATGAGTSGLFEGSDTRIPVNRYERNPVARRQCIEHYGATCSVCGFDFGRAYGDQASGYIHVHHLIPLSLRKQEYEVKPIEDLRPVCANCHAVLHLRNPPYSIEELKQSLKYTPVFQS
ncbi:HNH endonuclease [Hymenobacter canadensis]|uniref:HNH endonuclease n=1 Tax=Hymenobacter canadensis TaxID=2999067 RepID=A0ABY7LRF0_9BACT|nr:HNH endonuclease [Hymenobacter canadensis]WBA42992.1 HNH endonuclease [Hymenobacter canadensis]